MVFKASSVIICDEQEIIKVKTLRTSDLIMKDNTIVQYNGGNDEEEEEGTVEVLVSIPDRRVKVKVADEGKKANMY